MGDKTIIIIFCMIDILMWCVMIDYVIKMKRKDVEIMKKIAESAKKSEEYMHLTHDNMVKMTEMNVVAMKNFLEELSVKINKGQTDEAEDRK